MSEVAYENKETGALQDDDGKEKNKEKTRAVGLDAVRYYHGDIAPPDPELSWTVSTWMKMYDNLDGPNEYKSMRDVSIGIAKKLHKVYGQMEICNFDNFAEKYKASEPYHFFLTEVCNKQTQEQPYSVSFHEIIDCSLGELVDSLHINFCINLSWIVTEYMIACQNPNNMTVIFQMCMDPDSITTLPFAMDLHEINMPEYSCIHSKISILKYKGDKVRIIISTANLYALDWQTRTQGLWISPFLPLLPVDADDTDGESPTNFKRDFIEYLSQHKEPQVFGWLALMHRTDFSAVKVFFVASVPGNYRDRKFDSWGLNKLRKILSEHAVLPENAKDWPIVTQSSAVGSFGHEYSSWLGYIVQSMASQKNEKIIFLPKFKYIFPSKENYSISYDNRFGTGTCLIYNDELHSRQTWIMEYLCQWKAEKTCRSSAAPHLKSYTRISPDCTEIPWFFLTSANLSKAGMGRTISKFNQQSFLNMGNFEAGVVFIPKILIDRDTFPISENSTSDAPLFLLPYDVPLTPYEPDDEPFFSKIRVPEEIGELNEDE